MRTASCPRRVDAYSARCSSNSRHPHASRLCARSVSGLTSLPRAGLVPAAAPADPARETTVDREYALHRVTPLPRGRVAAHAASAGEAHDAISSEASTWR